MDKVQKSLELKRAREKETHERQWALLEVAKVSREFLEDSVSHYKVITSVSILSHLTMMTLYQKEAECRYVATPAAPTQFLRR